jgi:hypothetical protein
LKLVLSKILNFLQDSRISLIEISTSSASSLEQAFILGLHQINRGFHFDGNKLPSAETGDRAENPDSPN